MVVAVLYVFITFVVVVESMNKSICARYFTMIFFFGGGGGGGGGVRAEHSCIQYIRFVFDLLSGKAIVTFLWSMSRAISMQADVRQRSRLIPMPSDIS